MASKKKTTMSRTLGLGHGRTKNIALDGSKAANLGRSAAPPSKGNTARRSPKGAMGTGLKVGGLGKGFAKK